MRFFLFLFLVFLFISCSSKNIKQEIKQEETKKPEINTIKEETKTERIFHFTYLSNSAKEVFLAGNFNKWKINDTRYKFTKKENNQWILSIPESLLLKGRNEYKIIVDGEWTVNPDAPIENSGLSGKINVLWIQ